MSNKNIGKAVKQGVAWTTLFRILGILVQFSGGVILARILLPGDFGIIGMVMVAVSFSGPIRNFGFRLAFIQRKQITSQHSAALFWLDLSLQVTVWALLSLSAPAVAIFFKAPVIKQILPVLALYLIIGSIGTTPNALLQRRIDFKWVSLIDFLEGIVNTLSAVLLAVLGYGIWALVYSRLIGRATFSVASWIAAHSKPSFGCSVKAVKDLFGFGAWISARGFLTNLTEKADQAIIGRLLGQSALGFYERALNLMRLPQKKFGIGFNNIIFSAFARMQDEQDRMRVAFRKVILSTTLVIFPLLTYLMLIAPLFIPLVYGEKWRPSVLPLQILCMTGMLRATDPFLNGMITAAGHIKQLTYRRGLEAIMIIVGAVVGVRWGIVGVSVAITLSSLISMIYGAFLLQSLVRIPKKVFLNAQAPALKGSLVMAISILGGQTLLQNIHALPPVVTLLILTILAGLVYLATLSIIKSNDVTSLRQELVSDLKRALDKTLSFTNQRRPFLLVKKR